MSGVSYPRRYEVVTYPEGQIGMEGWAGFQAKIMVNPNGAEHPDGTTTMYPPPSEQWDVVYELEPSVMLWLALQIQVAYLPKATAPTPLATDAGTTDTTPPTEIPRQNSSTPLGSTLSA